MSLTVAAIINTMEGLFPPALAEEWDNTGLLVGDVNQNVERILVSLDVDEEVIDEAVHQNVHMIISHHPLIFHPVKNLLFHESLGKAIRKLIKNDIAVFCAHTNMDIAPGGINDFLAETLGLTGVEILAETKGENLFKLVVFVPQDFLDQVRTALCDAGAGYIGQYSHCTFAAAGEGTFLPLAGTNPFLGEQGKLEKAAEYRLETIVPQQKLKPVVEAMLKSHPYEEVAYDIFPTAIEGRKFGLGRVGCCPRPVTLAQLTEKVKSIFKVPVVRAAGDPEQVISKVAVLGGAGMSYLYAAKEKGAQCFITGDVKFHEAQQAKAFDIALIDAGHYATEALFIPELAKILRNKLSMFGIDVLTSEIKTNPWLFY